MTLSPAQQKKSGIRPYDTRLNPLSPPSVGIFDEPTRPVCINVDWIPHIEGLLERLVWDDAWEGTTEEVDTAIAEIRKLMVALAIGGDCVSVGNFRLRQNPNNPCELEQSTDGGNTYSLAFDYSLCMTTNAITSDDLVSLEEALQQILNQFDGSTGSVAPNMVYDSTPEDADRDLALCHAVNEMVAIMCEMELENRKQIALGSSILGAVIGLIGIAVTIGSGGAATPFYIALATAFFGGFATVFGGLSEAILTDQQARADVACCMYDALKGSTISGTAFENSLGGCGFSGLDNNAQLAGAIAQMLTAQDVYQSFLDQLEKAYTLANLGLVDCPCELPVQTFYLEADLTTGQHGSIESVSQSGNYVAGTGWVGEDFSTVTRLWFRFVFDPVTISYAEMRFSRTPSTSTGIKSVQVRNSVATFQDKVVGGQAYPYPSFHDYEQTVADAHMVQSEFSTSSNGSSVVVDRVRIAIEATEIPEFFTINGWTEYTP